MAEHQKSLDQVNDKLNELIRDIRVTMMTTLDPDGRMRSRPMATLEHEFDGYLYFFTDKTSGKISSLHEDMHVNCAYAEPSDQRYVSLSGLTEVIEDSQEIHRYWRPFMKAWFPRGEDDPNLVLLRVRVDEVEYWDSPTSKMVKLVGFVHALATGQRYEPGENQRTDLSH